MKTSRWLRIEFALVFVAVTIAYVGMARTIWQWLASWF